MPQNTGNQAVATPQNIGNQPVVNSSTSLAPVQHPSSKWHFPTTQNIFTFFKLLCGISLTIAGLVAAYLALDLAMWTAAKDFVEYCWERNV